MHAGADPNRVDESLSGHHVFRRQDSGKMPAVLGEKIDEEDMIIVSAGIPHWFKEVSTPVSDYVAKIVKP